MKARPLTTKDKTMKLRCVTITGADDGVTPDELVSLSEEFPFAEWGILFSSKHHGVPRWPSTGWVHRLAAIAERSPAMNLSAHLCGQWVRDLLAGRFTFAETFPWLLPRFARVQLNFHAEPQQVLGARFLLALQAHTRRADGDRRQFILQADGVNNAIFETARFEPADVDVTTLFDLSHGNGLTPVDWPRPYTDERLEPVYCGYAGGIGPDNVVEQLGRIAAAAAGGPFWIDMETRVRTPDDARLDMAKVRRVLVACAPFVAAAEVAA
jgi:hypothetical protein